LKKIHRIEIVVDAPHSARALKILAKHGLEGWSLFRGVSGSGERGAQFGDDITGVNNNHYILTTCPPEKLDEIAAALRPLLRRVGGICLISDAHWLVH